MPNQTNKVVQSIENPKLQTFLTYVVQLISGKVLNPKIIVNTIKNQKSAIVNYEYKNSKNRKSMNENFEQH